MSYPDPALDPHHRLSRFPQDPDARQPGERREAFWARVGERWPTPWQPIDDDDEPAPTAPSAESVHPTREEPPMTDTTPDRPDVERPDTEVDDTEVDEDTTPADPEVPRRTEGDEADGQPITRR